MKNKKIVFIFAIICMLILLFIYYIFSILGNNKNRSKEEIVEKLSKDFCSYEANITVEVFSNKNKNIYEIYQQVEDEKSKFIVKSPKEIEGLTLINEENKLKVENSKLKVEKIYQDYKMVLNNNLFINTFFKEIIENDLICYEKDNELILELKLNNNSNTYVKYKELHFDLETDLPKELLIKDNTQKTIIRIIYNDIKIK